MKWIFKINEENPKKGNWKKTIIAEYGGARNVRSLDWLFSLGYSKVWRANYQYSIRHTSIAIKLLSYYQERYINNELSR